MAAMPRDAAALILALEDDDPGDAAPPQRQGGSEPGRPGADDRDVDRCELGHRSGQAATCHAVNDPSAA